MWNIANFLIPHSYFIIVLRKLFVAGNSGNLHHTNINVGKSFNQKVGKLTRPGQKHFQENAEGLASLNAVRLCRKFMLLKHGSEQVLAPQVCCEAFFGVSNHIGIRQGWRSRCFKICILSITSLLWSSSSRKGERVRTELAELLTWASSKRVSFH